MLNMLRFNNLRLKEVRLDRFHSLCLASFGIIGFKFNLYNNNNENKGKFSLKHILNVITIQLNKHFMVSAKFGNNTTN